MNKDRYIFSAINKTTGNVHATGAGNEATYEKFIAQWGRHDNIEIVKSGV